VPAPTSAVYRWLVPPSDVIVRAGASPRRRLAALALAVGLAVSTGCGDDGGDGDGGGDAADVDRTVEVTATEYSFAGDPGNLVAGETIRFVVTNTGVVDHEMQVLGGTGRRISQTGRIAPGQSADAIVTFVNAGPYRLICDIDDHLTRGQSAGLTVAES
jgi:uncharacterized cupredoxin-like copper-binding protein